MSLKCILQGKTLGMTEEVADKKYLKIGNNYFDGADAVAPEDGISVSIYGGGRVYVYDDRLVLSKVNGAMVTFSSDGIAVDSDYGIFKRARYKGGYNLA